MNLRIMSLCSLKVYCSSLKQTEKHCLESEFWEIPRPCHCGDCLRCSILYISWGYVALNARGHCTISTHWRPKCLPVSAAGFVPELSKSRVDAVFRKPMTAVSISAARGTLIQACCRSRGSPDEIDGNRAYMRKIPGLHDLASPGIQAWKYVPVARQGYQP